MRTTNPTGGFFTRMAVRAKFLIPSFIRRRASALYSAIFGRPVLTMHPQHNLYDALALVATEGQYQPFNKILDGEYVPGIVYADGLHSPFLLTYFPRLESFIYRSKRKKAAREIAFYSTENTEKPCIFAIAVQNGSTSIVKELLKRGYKAESSFFSRFLTIATERKFIEIIKLLLPYVVSSEIALGIVLTDDQPDIDLVRLLLNMATIRDEHLSFVATGKKYSLLQILLPRASTEQINKLFMQAALSDDDDLFKAITEVEAVRSKISGIVINKSLVQAIDAKNINAINRLLPFAEKDVVALQEAMNAAIASGYLEGVDILSPYLVRLVPQALSQRMQIALRHVKYDLSLLELLLSRDAGSYQILYQELSSNSSTLAKMDTLLHDEQSEYKSLEVPNLRALFARAKLRSQFLAAVANDEVEVLSELLATTEIIAEKHIIGDAIAVALACGSNNVALHLLTTYPLESVVNEEAVKQGLAQALKTNRLLPQRLLVSILYRTNSAAKILNNLINDSKNFKDPAKFAVLLALHFALIDTDEDIKYNICGPRYAAFTLPLKETLNKLFTDAIAAGNIAVFDAFMQHNVLNTKAIFTAQFRSLHPEWQPGPHRALMTYLVIKNTERAKYDDFGRPTRLCRHDFMGYENAHEILCWGLPASYSDSYTKEQLFVVLLIIMNDIPSATSYATELQKILSIANLQAKHPEIAYAVQYLYDKDANLRNAINGNPAVRQNLKGLIPELPQVEMSAFQAHVTADPSLQGKAAANETIDTAAGVQKDNDESEEQRARRAFQSGIA